MTRCSWPLLLLLALVACGAKPPGSVAPADMPDPTTLARAGTPNDWLICPEAACAAAISAVSPRYPMPPALLLAAWRAMLADQPRVTLIAVDPARDLLLVQDRTPVLRFVDTVAIRVLPAGGGATFAAYSRSELGRYDFGTNRRRLEGWIAELAGRLAPTGPLEPRP